MARHLHEEELGVGCDLTVTLARNETAAMWLGGFVAYAGGFEFIHFGVCRDAAGLPQHTPDNGPVFGLSLSDGRELTFGGMPFRAANPRTLAPFLSPLWGHWHASRWMFVWSVRPLPPPGAMKITSAWPDAAIHRGDQAVDATPILIAAERAKPLWTQRD